jgi:hypothetical protein
MFLVLLPWEYSVLFCGARSPPGTPFLKEKKMELSPTEEQVEIEHLRALLLEKAEEVEALKNKLATLEAEFEEED